MTAKRSRLLDQSPHRRPRDRGYTLCSHPNAACEKTSTCSPSHATRQPRSPRVCYFAPALVMLLLALQWGGTTHAWGSTQIISLFVGAGVTSILFLAWDYQRGDSALLLYSVARQRKVWASCVVNGLSMGNLYIASYWFQYTLRV
jgi:hypothetical protein